MNDYATFPDRGPLPAASELTAHAHSAVRARHTQRQYGGGLLLEGCCCRRCLHNVIGISSASGKTTVTPEACRRDLDKMTRLADYFVVVGYDLDKRGKRETHSKRFFLLLFPSSSWSVRLECISRGLFTVNTAEGGGRGTQSRHSWFRPGMGELLSAADVPGPLDLYSRTQKPNPTEVARRLDLSECPFTRFMIRSLPAGAILLFCQGVTDLTGIYLRNLCHLFLSCNSLLYYASVELNRNAEAAPVHP